MIQAKEPEENPMHLSRIVVTALLGLVFLVPGRAPAGELPSPAGEILLTVTGRIAHTNDGDRAVFDRAMLEALGPVTFTTTTPWTEGPQTFTGVSLAAVAEAVGAEGDVLEATAINDYAVVIPREDWVEGGPIIAYLANGQPMSVRDKGPLWVVYPFDDTPAYRSEVSYSRSIWQLNRLVVAD